MPGERKYVNITCSWRDEREAWDENAQVEVINDSGSVKEVFSVYLEVWLPQYKRKVKPYTVSSHLCSNGFWLVKIIKEMGRLLEDGEKSTEVLATVRNKPEHSYSP